MSQNCELPYIIFTTRVSKQLLAYTVRKHLSLIWSPQEFCLQALATANIEVGSLFGYDAEEEISSKIVSDPNANRTLLGWCVIDSTGLIANLKLTFCNRISCSECTSVIFKSDATEVGGKDQNLSVYSNEILVTFGKTSNFWQRRHVGNNFLTDT